MQLCIPSAWSAFLVWRATAISCGGGWKETTSGAKDDRAQRNEVMTLAQARDVDVVLVSELTR